MTKPPAAPDRVSTLELFFDLVFVFTITQVSTVVVRSPDGRGLARAALELAVILWMYGGYAWMTNAVSSETWDRRLLLLLGMAGFFACSLAVPRAFDEDGIVFGAAYLFVTVVHLSGFLLGAGRTPLRAIYRLTPWNLASASLVLAAGWTHGNADWLLWGGAIAVQIATPFFARVDAGFVLNATHFAERHGLMILIVLGESLVSIGLAVEDRRVDLPLLFGAIGGLMTAAALWRAYFVADDTRAARVFEEAPPRTRADQAIGGYGLAHLVMIAGITAVAAGTKLSIHELTSAVPSWNAWLIAGGAALFMAGSAVFRLVMGFASPWPRLAGVPLCLAAVPAGTRGSTAAELAALALLITTALLIDHGVEWRTTGQLAR
jgi:low temperature requirement protein LtrA